jgi:hypothetical protein
MHLQIHFADACNKHVAGSFVVFTDDRDYRMECEQLKLPAWKYSEIVQLLKSNIRDPKEFRKKLLRL